MLSCCWGGGWVKLVNPPDGMLQALSLGALSGRGALPANMMDGFHINQIGGERGTASRSRQLTDRPGVSAAVGFARWAS